MVMYIVVIALVVALCLVALAAMGAILWLRHREQKRDEFLQNADALAKLDDALNDALRELNKVGNLVQKEITEKYQSMQFLYNMVEDKQKALEKMMANNVPAQPTPVQPASLPPAPAPFVSVAEEDVPPPAPPLPTNENNKRAAITSNVTSTEAPNATSKTPEEDDDFYAALFAEPDDVPYETTPPPPPLKPTTKPISDITVKPVPRKALTNPKHKQVNQMHEQGLSVAEIAREMSIGQGEVTLILEMTNKR